MQDGHVTISGFVQGVGFRQYVKRQARMLGLRGWVRNLPDKTVEAHLQGPKAQIESMISLCKKGPFLSEVEDILVVWEARAEVFQDFTIRHDM